MSDPQDMTRDEIIAGLNALAIPECTMFVHRADRHDPASKLQAVTLHCERELTYDQITQIAGLFETPHITFRCEVRKAGDCDGNMCADAVEPYIEILVKWEAPIPVSKAPGEKELAAMVMAARERMPINANQGVSVLVPEYNTEMIDSWAKALDAGAVPK